MCKRLCCFLFFTLAVFSQSLFADQPAPPALAPSPSMEAAASHPIPSQGESLLTKAQEPSYEHAFIKMILTLGGLLLLVFFTLWALRKLSHGRVGGFGSMKKIKVLEKRPLSPKTILYLLELDGKQVFVAESQLEVRAIFQPEDPDLD